MTRGEGTPESVVGVWAKHFNKIGFGTAVISIGCVIAGYVYAESWVKEKSLEVTKTYLTSDETDARIRKMIADKVKTFEDTGNRMDGKLDHLLELVGSLKGRMDSYESTRNARR